MIWHTRFGTCIYTSASGYKVFQNPLYRWLTFGNDALQTVINRRAPHKPVLYYLPILTLMQRGAPDDCCILGVGGGAALHMLHSQQTTITAVDKDEEVIDIARRFFMIDTLKNVNIIQQDAQEYLQSTNKTYKNLLIDLANAHRFPPECTNQSFFSLCREKTKDGFISLNCINLHEHQTLIQLLKEHFKNTLIIPIKKCTNVIIIASNHEDRNDFFNRIQHHGHIKKIFWIPPWGYMGA